MTDTTKENERYRKSSIKGRGLFISSIFEGAGLIETRWPSG